MSDITLVDINELASTISKDKDMLFVVEVPSGGGFIQRKVTKEVMFQLLGNNLDYTTSPGSQDVITFDGPSGNKVLYINNGSTGVMIFKLGVLGVSADGATNIIQMDTAGALRLGLGTTDGTLRILEDLELYEFTGRDLEQNVIVDLDIQNAATTEAVECRNSIAYLEVAAGGTIASHTIQFPVQARVGYTFEFYVKGTVTALTLDGGTATVDEALTTVTNGGGKWVRVVTGGGAVASWRRVRAELPSTSSAIEVLTTYPTTDDTKAGEEFIYRGVRWSYLTQDEIDALGWDVTLGFPAPVNKVYDEGTFFSGFLSSYSGQPIIGTGIIDFLGLGNPNNWSVLWEINGLNTNLGPIVVTEVKNANLLTNLEDKSSYYSLDLKKLGMTDVVLDSVFTQLPSTTNAATIRVWDNPGTGTCDPSIATAKGYTVRLIS